MSTGNLMPLLGGLILIGVLVYFSFSRLDSFNLPKKNGSAVVVHKDHVPLKTGYRTEYIGGQTRVFPQVTPDAYLMTLRIGNELTRVPVDRDLFDTINNGDLVAVTYVRTRLTRKLQVSSVQREVH